MALQLVANTKYLTGLPMDMSVTNTTPETDTYVEYDFQKDGVSVQKGASASYSKAKAALSDAGSWKVIGKKDDDTLVESTPVAVTIDKQTMTLTVTVAPTTKTVTIGDTVAFKATVGGAAPGTLNYEWTVDSVVISGATSADLNHVFTKDGTSKVSCKVTAKAADFNDATKTSSDSTITVKLKEMTNAKLSISPASQTVHVGESYTLDAVVEGVDDVDQLEMTYLWDTGETSPSVTIEATEEGSLAPSVTVELRAIDYANKSLTTDAIVIVGEAEVEGCIRYIHPLDHRESAYIWAGWWVMREIERATDLGIDWKKPDGTELKYKCDLKTLAKMLVDYPNVEVQESRNGYILDRETIESGVIY